MNVEDLIKIIDKYALDTTKRPWVIHQGDIVINSSKWRRIKKQLRNQLEREAENNENKEQTKQGLPGVPQQQSIS